MVRTQGFDHRSAHEARDDGDLRQGQYHDRPDLVDEGAIAPAADREPFEGQRKEELEERCDDECRDRAAGGRRGDDRIIGALVLVESRDDAERAAEDERENQRARADLDRHRQADPKELAHRKVRKVVARTEVAVQEALQIEDILFPERLVQMIDALEIGLDDRIQAFLLIERAARRHAHQEK